MNEWMRYVVQGQFFKIFKDVSRAYLDTLFDNPHQDTKIH